MSAGNTAMSAGNTAMSAGNTAMSAGNTAMSAGNTAMSAGNTAMFAGNTAMSAGNTAMFAGNTAMSAGNTAMSAGNTAMFAGNTAMSAGNTAMSAGNTAMLAANTITFYGKVQQLLKILVIIMMPVLLLTGLIAITFLATHTNYHQSSKIRSTLLYSIELGRVIHYLQEERDMSALYLSSTEEKTKGLLLKRYDETDRSLEELTSWITGLTLTRREFLSKGKFLSYLNKHRYELDTLNQTVVQELQMYTSLIRVFIMWLYSAITEDESGSIWRSLVAYQEVVIAKEYMGLERALGAIYFASGQFSSVDVYLWFLESQDVANVTFFSARQYSDLVFKLYTKFNDDQTLDGVLANMPADIQQNDSVSHGSVRTAQWWFTNKTVYMNLLLETQDELAVAITAMLDDRQTQNIRNISTTSIVFLGVLVISLVIIYTVYSLIDEIHNYLVALSKRLCYLQKKTTNTDRMLFHMVPESVASVLRDNKTVSTQTCPSVSILLTDIQGYTKFYTYSSPDHVLQTVNSILACFDTVAAKYDVYRVESIGDTYMVVSGVPEPNGEQHATHICLMALGLMKANNQLEVLHLPGNKLKLRTGVHTGVFLASQPRSLALKENSPRSRPVVVSLTGCRMPKYSIFGETVTIAAKMEAHGKPSKIHVSEITYTMLAHSVEFQMEERVNRNIMVTRTRLDADTERTIANILARLSRRRQNVLKRLVKLRVKMNSARMPSTAPSSASKLVTIADGQAVSAREVENPILGSTASTVAAILD
ncbi:uncharacterized protein LOC121379438 [Gigantopelta aegis]|uniref:uncharacterized protein LOC121379438 n=1 Tax=Gigantopelta aegis TaxID=1735272 RepID=UPI001B88C5D9|nr:uncharacterized protein LOC121379438 [Gigantopelta aegis]